MDKALALAEWDSFEERRAESEKNGKLRGIGMSCFVETAGGMLEEGAKLVFAVDGTVEARLAVQSNGQGHAILCAGRLRPAAGALREGAHRRGGQPANA